LIKQLKAWWSKKKYPFNFDDRAIKKGMKHYSKSELIKIICMLCRDKAVMQRLANYARRFK